jgi:ADP-ribose pyrophosphatase YjhB (NUDIX family)
MISVRISGQRFSVRAAAIIRDEAQILLHRPVGEEVWALPGGRVEIGEESSAAIAREMAEELGENIKIGRLVYVVENFFEYSGEQFHELGFYYEASLDSQSKLLDKSKSHIGVESNLKLEFRWFPSEELMGVNLRPSFLKETLAQAELGFHHVVHRS